MNNIKLWGLLENGDIEPLYYGVDKNTKSSDDLELRNIEYDRKHLYLYHDGYRYDEKGQVTMIATFCHKIVFQSNDIDEVVAKQQEMLGAKK